MKQESPSPASRTASCRAAGPPCLPRRHKALADNALVTSRRPGAGRHRRGGCRCSRRRGRGLRRGRTRSALRGCTAAGTSARRRLPRWSHREETLWYIAFMWKSAPATTRKPAASCRGSVRTLLGIDGLDGPAPLEPLRRGGHQPKGCLTSAAAPCFPSPSWTTAYGAVPEVRGRMCSPRSTCPASSTSGRIPARRVHPAHLPGRAAPRCAPPSVYAA